MGTKIRTEAEKLPLWKRAMFTVIGLLCSLAIAVAALLFVDLYLHHKFDKVGTVNRRGYRGSIVGEKKPRELRLVVLGGSTAYGYGVGPKESFPAQLENELRAYTKRPVTVVNLASNGAGAYYFLPTLQDYAYLDYDDVILYEGYNDLTEYSNPELRNLSMPRRDSPIFRAFGYYPITPLILTEKIAVMRSHGKPGAADGEKRIVFRPGLADRTKAGALDAAANVSRKLNDQLSRPSGQSAFQPLEDCSVRGVFYCGCVRVAIEYATTNNHHVFVVSQPYISPDHIQQQHELASMIAKRFGSSRNVTYVNLGDAINLHDRNLVYDGMHLVAAGNRIIAKRLAMTVASALGLQ